MPLSPTGQIPTVNFPGGTDTTFKTVNISNASLATLINSVFGHPGYVAGRVYPVACDTATAFAAANNSTTLCLSAFSVPLLCTPLDIGIVVTAGGAGSTAKCGLWASNPTTFRPTGKMLAGSGSNNALNTTGTGFIGNLTTIQLVPGTIYWFGCAFTATLPTVIAYGGNQTVLEFLIGKATAVSGAILGLTAPFTFGNDITALDLTSATFSDVGTAGNPIAYLQF